MSRTLVLIVIVVLAAGMLLSRADETDLKTVTTDDLIARLDSADFAEREQASKELQARGPGILPALRKALKHEDAEVRRRAKELIPPLEDATAIAPKRVTLNVKDQPLSTALKEIKKQTGYAIEEEERNDDKRFTFEMKDVTFWEALDHIQRKTGNLLDRYFEEGTGDHLILQRSKTTSRFTYNAGSFRLKLYRFHEDRTLEFEAAARDGEPGRRTGLLKLGVTVMAEPRLIFLKVGEPQVNMAVDEDGKAYVVPPPPGKGEFLGSQGWGSYRCAFMQFADLRLERSSDKARTIKELRGSIPVQVVAGRKPLLVTEDVLNLEETEFPIGNELFKIKITSVDQTPGRYIAQLAFPDSPTMATRSLPSHFWGERIHLEDAEGNRLGHNVRAWNPGISCWIEFSQPKDGTVGPPARLIVDDWTIVHHSIPFIFKDVPLP